MHKIIYHKVGGYSDSISNVATGHIWCCMYSLKVVCPNIAINDPQMICCMTQDAQVRQKDGDFSC